MIKKGTYGLISLLSVLLVTLEACDVSVNPILGTDQAFSVYGVFTSDADTQTVQVIPIRPQLALENPETPIDAEVVSVDETTDTHRIWRDSLVVFGDGSHVHVF